MAIGPVQLLVLSFPEPNFSGEIVAELKTNKRPSNMKPDEAIVYDFVTELTAKHQNSKSATSTPPWVPITCILSRAGMSS